MFVCTRCVSRTHIGRKKNERKRNRLVMLNLQMWGRVPIIQLFCCYSRLNSKAVADLADLLCSATTSLQTRAPPRSRFGDFNDKKGNRRKRMAVGLLRTDASKLASHRALIDRQTCSPQLVIFVTDV